MDRGWVRASLDTAETDAERPGKRWVLSSKRGADAYDYNVDVLDSDERLSENTYHYHEEQAELVHIVAGQWGVETGQTSFDLAADELVCFRASETHLLQNPFEEACRLIGVGSPPEGRYPVCRDQSYEELLAKRYPDGETPEPSTEV